MVRRATHAFIAGTGRAVKPDPLTDPIVDIKVVQRSSKQLKTAAGRKEADGYSLLLSRAYGGSANLNDGSGGSQLFIAFRR